MKFSFVLLAVALVLNSIFCSDDIEANIVQLSRVSKKSNVRKLKANLFPCKLNNRHGIKCKPKLEIKAWMDPKEQETFLLIDEAYDIKGKTVFPLLRPYLIQVSTGEQTVAYPLLLQQIVEVNCNESEFVQRRDVVYNQAPDGEGNSVDSWQARLSQSKGERNMKDSKLSSGNDFLLYLSEAEKTTKSAPVFDRISFPRSEKLPTAIISSEHEKLRIKLNPLIDNQSRPQNDLKTNEQQNRLSNVIKPTVTNEFNRNVGLKLDGSPTQFVGNLVDSVHTADSKLFHDTAARFHQNPQHQLIPLSHQQNRFFINQNENFNEKSFTEFVLPRGVNDDLLSSKQLRAFEQKKNLQNPTSSDYSSKTDDIFASKLQDLIDLKTKLQHQTQIQQNHEKMSPLKNFVEMPGEQL